MDCSEAFAIVVRHVTGHSQALAVLAAAQEHCASCPHCRSSLAALGAALGELPADAASHVLPCDDVAADIPFYIELEAAGQDPARQYPQLHAHLQGCARCREECLVLRELVRAEQRGELACSPVPARRPPILLRIARAFLQQTLFPTSVSVTRADDLAPQDRHVLFRDTVAHEPEEWVATVELRRHEPPAIGWRILVRVIGDQPVAGLPVTLACGPDQRSATTDGAGIAAVDDLPASWFSVNQGEDIQVRLG